MAAGMFTQNETGFLEQAVIAEGTTCLVEDADHGGLACVVLFRAEEAADRAVDLTMIAVRPDLQGGDDLVLFTRRL